MTIIVADDEKIALNGTVAALKRICPGDTVIGFSDGKSVVEFAQNHIIDIAFLDIVMTGISGVEVAVCIQQVQPEVNIIFLTGYDNYMQDAFSLYASGYILKPATEEKLREQMQHLRYRKSEPIRSHIRIQTFGNFEVFIDEHPVDFHYSKTREFLAYLVDRQGAMCSNSEITQALWPGDLSVNHSSYLQNIRFDLIRTFTKYNCAEVLCVQRGKISIDPSAVDCDLFEWMRHHRGTYSGEYMKQYEWAQGRQ